jgi:hypothetical protein
MRDQNLLSFSQHQQIVDDLRTMSEIIRAARDEALFPKMPELLINPVPADEARHYAKNPKK